VSTNEVVSTGRRRRRRHSEMFKAEAIGACQQAGVSIAAVALARGLNANMLRHWVRLAERNAPIAIRPTVPEVSVENAGAFVPVPLSSSSPTDGAIRIELRRKGHSVSIAWPASAARECALLLRELMK
jgi:transposase